METLGSAILELGVDEKGLQTGMAAAASGIKNLQNQCGPLMNQLALMSAAIIGVGTVSVMNFAKTGEAVADLAIKTGLTTTQIQEFSYAAKLSGADLSDLDMSIKRMQVSVAKLGDGDKALIDTYKELGLSFEQLKTMNPGQQFETIMAAIGKMPAAFDRTAAAVAIFGRSGTTLLPMAAQMQALIDQAHKLGFVLSEDDIKNAKELDDSIKTLQTSFAAAANQIVGKFAPQLVDLATKITAVVIKTGDWITANPGLVKAIMEGAIAIMVVVAAFKAMAVAQAIAMALSGPAGWATLAVGAAIATAAIIGINNALDDTIGKEKQAQTGLSVNTAVLPGESKEDYVTRMQTARGYASGGIVTSPQLAMVGESGPEAIVPLNQMNSFGGRSLSVNVGNFMGDDMSLRQFTRQIHDLLNEETQRSIMPRVQSTFYSVGGHL